MAVKKKSKKPAKKRAKAVKAPTKRMKKEIRTLRKGLSKETRITSKQGKELALLKNEIDKLKKKKTRKGLSDYQRFMRVQIKKGLSFKQAAALWGKRKRAEAAKSRKRSAYNVFISMQLKQGKTMKQVIRAWNRLKNPPKKRKKSRPKRKPKKRPKRKKARAVKSKKAARKKKPKKRRAAKRKPRPKPRARRAVAQKPVVVTREVFPAEKVSAIVNSALKRFGPRQEKSIEKLKKLVSRKTVSKEAIGELGGEELALKMLDVYFSEVARFGLKRRLTLDEVINAYFYALARVQRKGVELKEISEVVGRKK